MFWNKSKEHAESIEKIALSMIERNDEVGALPFLSMKDAERYAQGKEPLISRDFVQCHVIIGKGYYSLEFTPHPKKGVYMRASYYGEASKVADIAKGVKGSSGWR